jgi:hypothetical protein
MIPTRRTLLGAAGATLALPAGDRAGARPTPRTR